MTNNKQTMKLYTEEQVREAMSSARVMLPRYDNDIILSLTPIELPSDEEIEETFTFYPQIIVGAKWMKEQILKQD